jgi:hypothetical protein
MGKPKSKTSNREYGLGTRIASRFHKIGLRQGEEIQELRGFSLEPINFED